MVALPEVFAFMIIFPFTSSKLITFVSLEEYTSFTSLTPKSSEETEGIHSNSGLPL